MAEHSPAPASSRGIYGFVVYLLFSTLFVFYVLWTFIPLEIYEKLGITELPNKYFALFIPILVLTATTLFAFLIYPGISLCMTPNIDAICTIKDKHAVTRCQFRNDDGVLCDNKIDHDPFISWQSPRHCESHYQSSGSRIVNYCDCTEKEKCLLYKVKDHTETLGRRESFIQNSADLNIEDVSDVLYGDDEIIKRIKSCI
jgi:phosphatidylinositol glycan class P protein